MNQIYVKNASLVGVGLAVGGAAGYFFAMWQVRRAMKKVVDVLNNGDPNELVDEWLHETDTAVQEKVDKVFKTDYTAHSKDKASLEKLVEPYKSEKPIRVITEEEVASTHGHTMVLVTYYEGDNIYAGEDEKMIETPNEVFIPNAHLHFGEDKAGDPDILYIRNDNLGVDFEITRVKGKYSVLILGEVETTKKPRAAARRSRARKTDEVTNADRDDDKEK